VRGDFHRYWRSRSYWRHLGRKYASVWRTAGALALVLLLAGAGFIAARSIQSPETFTIERLVTVVNTVSGEEVTHVIRSIETLTEEEVSTNMVTVVRDGRTITIPAETVRTTDTVRGPTITKTNTETETSTRTRTQTERETTTNTETQRETQTETQTTDRVTTETETRDVPGPERTTTETVTETGPTTTETETETETQTETVTETVTEPPPEP
jgi:hypothetical protein